MPSDPVVEPLVPSRVVGSDTIEHTPLMDGRHEIATFSFVRTWDWEVTVAVQKGNIGSSTVPANAEGIKEPVEAELRGRKEFSKLYMAEAKTKRRGGNTNNSDNTAKVIKKDGGNMVE